MSALTTLQNSWPERTPVRHRETGATGVIAPCPARDPISRDHAGGVTTAYLLLDGSKRVVWVRWTDRPGCWMNPRWLQKARTS